MVDQASSRPSAAALACIEIFKSLSIDSLQEISSKCSCTTYTANQQIIKHQDCSNDVYFICSGAVRATIYSASGKEVTFEDLSAGQVFGELSAIDAQPRSTYVVALGDSLIATMSASEYWRTLHKYPGVAEVTFRRLTGMVRMLCERILEFSTLGVRNRIHAELLRLAGLTATEGNSVVIDPFPTHAEIASRVSTHREAVTRELNELDKMGILDRSAGNFIVKDIAALRKMVEDVRSGGSS